MRARWAVPTALAVVLACAPARAELRARTRDLGGVTVATGNVDFASQPTSATCAAPTSLAMTRPSGAATFTRSDTSPACCPESDAACCAVAIDQPCVHSSAYAGSLGGAGVEVFGPGANALVESRSVCNGTSFRTGWNPSGAPTTCTAGTTMGPWSNSLSGKLTYTASSYAYATAFTGSTVPYTLECWMKADTGSPRPYLSTTPDNVNFYARGLCPVLTSTWQRCVTTGTMGTGAQYLALGIHPGDAQQNQGVAGTIWVTGCQATPTAQAAPYRETTGAAYVGSASTATSLVLPATATNKDKWAISIKATPAGAGWARTNTIGLWQWGGNYGAANSVSAYIDASSKIVVEVYDGSSGWKRWTSTNALTGAVQRSIAVAFNGGAYRVLVDGSEVAGSTSGAGTGLLGALPAATLTLGIVGSSVLSGTVACVRQGADLAAVKGCQ